MGGALSQELPFDSLAMQVVSRELGCGLQATPRGAAVVALVAMATGIVELMRQGLNLNSGVAKGISPVLARLGSVDVSPGGSTQRLGTTVRCAVSEVLGPSESHPSECRDHRVGLPSVGDPTG